MTSDKNEQLRANLLKKLKGLEIVIGCSTEDLLTVLAMEMSARIPAQGEVNIDALAAKVAALIPLPDVQKMTVAIETKVAMKLDEVMSLLNKGLSDSKPDPDSIIKGVAAILQPQIAQAAQSASEAVFAANSKAIMDNIKTVMDQRYKELAETAGGSNGEPNTNQETQMQKPPGGGMGGIMQMAVTNPEGLKSIAESLKSIIEIFKPAPAGNPALNDFQKYMGFHDLMTKIEKRVATSEDITKGITEVFSAPGQGGQAAPAK
jgi:hypothetical protein